MASQPANTDILVHRRIRAQTDNLRHTTVKEVLNPFTPKVMAVPSREIMVYETRDDTHVTGAFRYGFPVVVQRRDKTELATAINGISGLNFPVRFPGYQRDVFLEKDDANVADDIQQDLRDVAAPPDGLFEPV